jgi:hypothetical protein
MGACFLANFAGDPNRQDLPLMSPSGNPAAEPATVAAQTSDAAAPEPTKSPMPSPPREIGGRAGPDPTRYGDWELKGRCIDF